VEPPWREFPRDFGESGEGLREIIVQWAHTIRRPKETAPIGQNPAELIPKELSGQQVGRRHTAVWRDQEEPHFWRIERPHAGRRARNR